MNKITRDYTLIEEIGRGGMAVVYKGWQKFLARPIVIKELVATSRTAEEFIKRFEREAKLVANLNHENIVIIHDGWKEKEKIYIVMEYIDGIDLKRLLISKKKIPIPIAIYIMWALVKALEYAHKNLIVHRDIKPANILISKKGCVKLVDFGVARDLNNLGLTSTGEMIGTPSYMSPEQIKGEKADIFTDIFCLGIVAYEMIEGHHPFSDPDTKEVKTGNILDNKVTGLKKTNEEIPYEIDRIIRTCLAKNPSKRYVNVERIRKILDKNIIKYSQKKLEEDLAEFIVDCLPDDFDNKDKTVKINESEVMEVKDKSENESYDRITEVVVGAFLMVFVVGCIGLVVWRYAYMYFK